MDLFNIHNFYILFFIGATIGFLSGLLGKGGSAISTPALQVFGGVNAFAALSSPLPASLPSAISASVAYRKEKLIDFRVVKIILGLGIPATLLGAYYSDLFEGRILMLLTAIFLLFLGASFFIRISLFSSKKGSPVTNIPVYKVISVALGVGFLSGLLANSGGALLGPLFIRYFKMPVKKALASSLIAAAGLAIPGTLAHWYFGHIDWLIVLILSGSSIPFSFLGAKSAIKLDNNILEKAFGLILIGFGIFDVFYNW